MLVKYVETASQMQEEFKNMNRDNFTYPAYQQLLEIFNESEENIEFDVIDIVCNYSEYNFRDLIDAYSSTLLDEVDSLEDIDRDNIAELLEDYTQIYELENGNFLVVNF